MCVLCLCVGGCYKKLTFSSLLEVTVNTLLFAAQNVISFFAEKLNICSKVTLTNLFNKETFLCICTLVYYSLTAKHGKEYLHILVWNFTLLLFFVLSFIYLYCFSFFSGVKYVLYSITSIYRLDEMKSSSLVHCTILDEYSS